MNMEVDLPKDHNINSRNNMMANKQVKSNSIEILKETQIPIDETENRSKVQTATLSSLEKNPFVPTIVVSKFTNPSPFITNQNESLNLKEIPISKAANSNVKANHFVVPNKITKKPITIISPSTIFRLQPKLNTVGANTIKPNQQVKIISSLSKPRSELYIVPHNGMNYVVKKVQSKPENDSSEKYSSIASPSTIKSINNLDKFLEQNKKIIVKKNIPQAYGKRKIPNTTQVEKLPDGSFRMVQNKDAPQSLIKFVGKTFTTNMVTNVRPLINTVPSGTIKPQVVKTFQYINPNQVRFIQPRNNLPTPLTYKPSKYINTTKGVKILPHSITKKDQSDNQQTGIKPTTITAYNINNITESSTLKLVPVNDLKRSKFVQLSKAQIKNLHATVIQNKKNDLKSASGTTAMSNKTIDKFPKILNSNTAVEKSENKTKKRQNEEFEDDDKSSCLVCCQYEYCETIVLERELVDNMFCSVSCRNSAYGITTTELKEAVSPPKKPKLDRRMILEKLRNMIELKRSKLQSEKTDSKDCLNKVNTLENSSNKSELNTEINNPKQLKTLKAVHSKPKTTAQKNKPEKKLEISSCTSPVVKNSSTLPKSVQGKNAVEDGYLKSVEDGKKILSYVKIKEFRSAPKKLFNTPFPDKINEFKANQKLEGIDPEHEAIFCVMTVIEVCGFRIKLHFDGYPDDYDFWVNADCPNLFYANWCNENSRTLEPPKNYKKPFNWSVYLLKNKATPVPKNILVSTVNTTFFQDHKFKIGDKLEALDKVTRTLAKQLICVATVADILGRRIRVHFDGWTDDFDYWTDISSTNLHPIKWCDSNGRSLSPPYGYTDSKGRKRFCWAEYLKETNSQAVPENAFIRVPLRDFSVDMAIEIVDLVLPSLIRVAKVVNVKDNEIKILYDGFHPDYAYWVEDDNPDIHPIGWCFKTSHPLEIPSETLWSCNVAGCNGIGNLNSSKLNHISNKDCPYELETWKKMLNGTLQLLDRLTPDNVPRLSMAAATKNSKYRKNEPKIKGKNNIREIEKKKPKGKKKGKLQKKEKNKHQKKTINERQEKEKNEYQKKEKEKKKLLENEKNEHQEKKQNEHKEKEKSENQEIEKIEIQEIEKNEIQEIEINENEIKIELEENTDIINSNISYEPENEIKNTKLTVKLEIEDNDLKINRTCDIVREYKKKSINQSIVELHLKWSKFSTLKSIPIFSTKDPRQWSVEEVANFADLVVKNQNIDNPITVSHRFIAEEIDGEGFLMLNKNDLLFTLNIPLGPALKLNNVIKILQLKASIFQHVDSQVPC